MLILYNITAKASFYDRANLGDYNFTVAYTWGGKNVVQTVTSTIFVIDACIKNVNKPTVPAIPIKFLMDLDTFVDVKPVIDVNHTFCLYNISMSYIKLSGPVSSGPTIFFTTMINETFVNVYDLILHVGGEAEKVHSRSIKTIVKLDLTAAAPQMIQMRKVLSCMKC